MNKTQETGGNFQYPSTKDSGLALVVAGEQWDVAADEGVRAPGTGDEAIVRACREAAQAEQHYALKALVAGVMLAEKRERMAPLSHCGTTGRFEVKEHGFRDWLESVGISKTTAYRWMDCATKVLAIHAGGTSLDAWRALTGGVEDVPVSLALTAPVAELPERAAKLQQDVFAFMADKTLGEAARMAFEGETPAKRITQVGAGKVLGGTTRFDDRKAFDRFAAMKLRHLTTFLCNRRNNRWLGWRDLPAAQQAAISGAFSAAMEQWPGWLLAVLADKARQELKMPPEARSARNASAGVEE